MCCITSYSTTSCMTNYIYTLAGTVVIPTIIKQPGNSMPSFLFIIASFVGIAECVLLL